MYGKVSRNERKGTGIAKKNDPGYIFSEQRTAAIPHRQADMK